MPRNKNGRKKLKDTISPSENDHHLQVDKTKVSKPSPGDWTITSDLEYLQSMFSDVDAEITQAVYIECGKDVHQAMETMIEMCDSPTGQSSPDQDQSDLATIACSLLHQDPSSSRSRRNNNDLKFATENFATPTLTKLMDPHTNMKRDFSSFNAGRANPAKEKSRMASTKSVLHNASELVNANIPKEESTAQDKKCPPGGLLRSALQSSSKNFEGSQVSPKKEWTKAHLSDSTAFKATNSFLSKSRNGLILNESVAVQSADLENTSNQQVKTENYLTYRGPAVCLGLDQSEPFVSAEWEEYYKSVDVVGDGDCTPAGLDTLVNGAAHGETSINSLCGETGEKGAKDIHVKHNMPKLLNASWKVNNVDESVILKTSKITQCKSDKSSIFSPNTGKNKVDNSARSGLKTPESFSSHTNSSLGSCSSSLLFGNSPPGVNSYETSYPSVNDTAVSELLASSGLSIEAPAFIPRSVVKEESMEGPKSKSKTVVDASNVSTKSKETTLQPLESLAAVPLKSKKNKRRKKKESAEIQLLTPAEVTDQSVKTSHSTSKSSGSSDSNCPAPPISFSKENIQLSHTAPNKKMPSGRGRPPWAPDPNVTKTHSPHLSPKKEASVLKPSEKNRSHTLEKVFRKAEHPRASLSGSESSGGLCDDLPANLPASPKTANKSFTSKPSMKQPFSSVFQLPPPVQQSTPLRVKESKSSSSSLQSQNSPKSQGKPNFSTKPTRENLPASSLHFQVESMPSHKSEFARNRLVFRGVKSPVGVIRRYILEKQPVMVILRGLPGSGKSHLAQLLISEAQAMGVAGVILSTDEFFMRGGTYKFNRNDLGQAHEWNRKRALVHAKESRSPIIIDNTNTTLWELLPYAVVALDYRYDVQIFEPDTPWKFKLGDLVRRNTHSVNRETLLKMKDRYETVTLEKVFAEANKMISKRKPRTLVQPTDTVAQTKATKVTQPSATGVSSSSAAAAATVPPGPVTLKSSQTPAWVSKPWGASYSLSSAPLPQRQKSAPEEKRTRASGQQGVMAEVAPSHALITPEFLRQSLKEAIVSSITGHTLGESFQNLTTDRAARAEGTSPPQYGSSENDLRSGKKALDLSLATPPVIGTNSSWRTDANKTTEYSPALAKENHMEEKMVVHGLSPRGRTQSPACEETGLLAFANPKMEGTLDSGDSEESVTKCVNESGASDAVFVLARDIPSCSTSGSFRSCASDADPASDYRSETRETAGVDGDVDVKEMGTFDIDLHGLCLSSLGALSTGHNPGEAGDFYREYHRENSDGTVVGDTHSMVLNVKKNSPETSHQEICSAQGSPPGSITSASDKDKVTETACVRQVSDRDSSVYSETEDVQAEFVLSKSKMIEDVRGVTPDKMTSNSKSSRMLDKGSHFPVSLKQNHQSAASSLVDYSDSGSEQEESKADHKVSCCEVAGQAAGHVIGSTHRVQVSSGDKETSNQNVCDNKIDNPHAEPHSNLNPKDPPYSGVHQPDKESNASPPYTSSQVASPKRKKKTQSRKGKEFGSFLEAALREKSKGENWSSFFTPPCIGSGLEELVLEEAVIREPVETRAAVCQCDPYLFSLVHKLNSVSFTRLQPVDVAALCDDGDGGLTVLASSVSNSSQQEQRINELDELDSFEDTQSEETRTNKGGERFQLEDCSSVVVPRKSDTADCSTSTEDMLDQEQIDLETLQCCFPEYSLRQLEEVMSVCHNNLEWVTLHLLDSPALIDLEEGAEEVKAAGFTGQEGEELRAAGEPRLVLTPRSLAQLCRSVVRKYIHVDADDLEMQVIKAGQTRLQRIERHHWSRLSSQGGGGGRHKQELSVWPDDLRLEEFTGTVEPEEFWEWQALSPKVQDDKMSVSSVLTYPRSPQSPSALAHKSPLGFSSPVKAVGNLSFLREENRHVAPFSPQKSRDSRIYELHQHKEERRRTVSEKPKLGQAAVSELRQAVVPQEFIHSLEKLFGPLGVSEPNEDLVLDDSIAHKVYKCLKLQVASKKVVTSPPSSSNQVQNDEALARALQEEEDLRSSNSTLPVPEASPYQHQQTPGWTSDALAWILDSPTAEPSGFTHLASTSSSQSPTVVSNSVSETLHRLQGNKGLKKLTPFKFHQHWYDVRAGVVRSRGTLGMASPWTRSTWAGSDRHVDSMHSIMEEQRAVEASRQEQLRLLEATGENQALSTRIKRSQLTELFPSLAPDFLDEVFIQTGYSMERTVEVLETTYGVSSSNLALEVEDVMVKRAEDVSWREFSKQQQRTEEAESFQYIEDPESVTYQDLRAEAQFYRGLAKECQEQASRHHREGLQGAALFYRQRAKKYKEEEQEANQRAAHCLFDKGSERLNKENTLDLHFYHLDEAIAAVNHAISLKEEEYHRRPSKKSSYLNIVTGRGKNSKGGIPRLKPAVIGHLRDRCLVFEEKSPGMLRVQIGQRL